MLLQLTLPVAIVVLTMSLSAVFAIANALRLRNRSGHAYAPIITQHPAPAGDSRSGWAVHAEICGKLTRDQSVRWSFQAAAPLNFNIHYHEGKKVEYPARQDGVRESQGTLPVPLDQDYCWMWVNKSGVPISLQVQLAR